LTKRAGNVQLRDRKLTQELEVVDQRRRKFERQVTAGLDLDGQVDEDGSGCELDDALAVGDVGNRKGLGLVVENEQLEHRHEVGRRVFGDRSGNKLEPDVMKTFGASLVKILATNAKSFA